MSTERAPIIRLVVGLAMLLGQVAAIGQDSPAFALPAPTVGSIWKYRQIDLQTDRELSTFQFELVEVQADRLIHKSTSSQYKGERTYRTDRDLSPCRKIRNDDKEICAGALKFPLRIGDKHRYDKQPWPNGEGYNTEQCEAKALESVTVPAGTFDAVRVECDGSWIQAFDRYSGLVTETWWYAPKVNRFVKWTYTDRSVTKSIRVRTQSELTEFIAK
jgi:hypothetical protein